jgi:hypothetical protein
MKQQQQSLKPPASCCYFRKYSFSLLVSFVVINPLTFIFQPFFGAMGCTAAIVFTCFGASYGTAKSGVGICATGVLRPDLMIRSMLYTFVAKCGLLSGFE